MAFLLLEFNLHENPKYHYYDEDCYHFFGTEGSNAFPSFRMFSYDDNHYGWEHELIREDFDVLFYRLNSRKKSRFQVTFRKITSINGGGYYAKTYTYSPDG